MVKWQWLMHNPTKNSYYVRMSMSIILCGGDYTDIKTRIISGTMVDEEEASMSPLIHEILQGWNKGPVITIDLCYWSILWGCMFVYVEHPPGVKYQAMIPFNIRGCEASIKQIDV